MLIYRFNQALAVLVGGTSLSLLLVMHHGFLVDFRLALLLYSGILILSISYFAEKNLVAQKRYRRFGALLILTSTGIYLTFMSSNLLALGVGWSVSGVGASLLVNHANVNQSRRATLIVLRTFLISDLSFWVAIALAHYNHINPFAAWGSDASHRPQILELIALLFAVSGIIRSGLFPAMRWLILSVEAPTPLSALLHAGIVNGFGYLLVAMPIIHKMQDAIIIIALLTITLSLSIMRHRHDEKGKLANGTSMQMAFMALEGVLGIPGIVLLHIVGHGSYKSWSFLRAGGAPLRRKNAIPIPIKIRPHVMVLSILTALYVASVGTAYWWVGTNLLLNLSVGAIALASSLMFAANLSYLLMLESAAFSYAAFFLYLEIVKRFSGLFSRHWEPSTLLLVVLSLIIVLNTLIFRIISRSWTLRIASRLNNYYLGRTVIQDHKARKAIETQISEQNLMELLEITGAPFASGGALSQIVAQDSLVGLHNLNFRSAAELASEYGISMYSSSKKYLSYLERGVISKDALAQTLENAEAGICLEELIEITQRDAIRERLKSESDVQKQIVVQSNWWCSQAWFEGANDQEGGAYGIWRTNLGKNDSKLFPIDPTQALGQSLEGLISQSNMGSEITPKQIISTLRQLIALDISWFIFVKSLGRDAEISLLALRATIALLIREEISIAKPELAPHAEIWQRALELTFAVQLKSSIAQFALLDGYETPKETALVTCIDVRSDVLRQRAEELPGVRTFGMAGFFGVDLCLTSTDKTSGKDQNYAPIILDPSISISDDRDQNFTWLLPSLWKDATSGTGALAMAEAFGLFNGLLNSLNTFFPGLAHRLNRRFDAPRWMGSTGDDPSLLTLDQKISYAQNILSTISLQGLKEVIFVGHGADASNNPLRSMYECGACGGNNGLLNARFAAKLMSDAEIQKITCELNNGEPVRFYAAEHNTTRGSFEFDPFTKLPADENAAKALKILESELSHLPRRSYPGSLSLSTFSPPSAVAWWQVFPEWGLSANAACVIGPRYLTVNTNLRSRVFLHDYNWMQDFDGAILNSIFAGPGVVMQMINFAYNIAVTDSRNFSSGDKTRHNVLGEAGVLLGSEGPLLRSLPWQSISTLPDPSDRGAKGHIPIRLQLFVAAPQTVIDRALENSPLAPLVTGGWIALHCLAEVELSKSEN